MEEKELILPPKPSKPRPNWQHLPLWKAVREAIYTLPSRFRSDLTVSGVLATDLYAFNSSLATTIEEQVVGCLNGLRTLWDPDERYTGYTFVRRPQTFPDVVLKASSPTTVPKTIMGIELKGWYVLAKEKEPSFRYRVTPAVCDPADLLVVVPWALSQVVSGSPQAFRPLITGARYAAEYGNWYWQYQKKGPSDRGIALSAVITKHPAKADMISDRPVSDAGRNFGRIARTGIMDSYKADLFRERLAGIALEHWVSFLSLFTESTSDEKISRGLERISRSVARTRSRSSDPDRVRVLEDLQKLAESLGVVL